MKKIAIALLVSAGFIGAAAAQVTISGVFDASYQNQKSTYGDGSSVTQNSVANNNQGTSQITFTGKEVLGNGMAAIFKLENDFDASKDGTNNLGSKGGEQFVGVESGFGTVKLGAPNYPSLGIQSSRSPFGTKIGGGFGGVAGAGRIRPAGNAVAYASPSVGGLTVSALYVNQTNADTIGAVAAVDAITDIAAVYTRGPFTAGVSQFATNGTDAKQVNYFGSVTFGPAKVIVGGHDETSSAGAKSGGNNIAASYTVGLTTFMGNYGKLDDKSSANADKTISAVGVSYAMSKRTSVYARYVDESNDRVTSTAVASRTTTFVGMQHNF